MKKIFINGWEVEIAHEYHTEHMVESLEALLSNHVYNANKDWEQYRKVGNRWRKKKAS